MTVSFVGSSAQNGVPEDREHQGGVLMDCLRAVCLHYEMPFSAATALNQLPLKDGVLTPSAFERAATTMGFVCRTAKRPIEAVNKALLPAVLILENQQACVIFDYDLDKQSASVALPELSEIRTDISLTELTESYTDYVIFLRPKPSEHYKKDSVNAQVNGHWFWGVIKQTTSLYRDVIFASLFVTLLSVALPLFVMNVYDRVVPNAALETLWVLAIGVGVALMVDVSLRSLRQFFVELTASRVDINLSSVLMQKVMGMSFYDKPQSTGAFVNSIQSFDAIRNFFNSATLLAMVDLPFALVFIAIIAFMSWPLVIPILAGGVIIFVYSAFVQKSMRGLSDEAINISSARNSALNEAVSMFDEVKFFNASSHFQYSWERLTVYLTKVNAKMRMLNTSLSNMALFIQQSVGVVIIIGGVFLITENELTQGALIASYLLSSRAMGPIAQAASLFSQYHQAATAYSALDEIMQREDEAQRDKEWTEHSRIKGKVEFRHLSFHYPEVSKNQLEGLHFTIQPGEHVAILGKNGCGKSTLNRLLLKSMAPVSGQILLDNIDLGQYQPSLLRQCVGYVPQDIALFSDTLKHNITQFNAVNEDRIWELLTRLGLSQFVNSHPDGLNMQVGEKGALLSGGQRQAVALMRALLKSPDMFIFDEPTSFMDSTIEQQIVATLHSETQGKTLILNTHRMSLLDLVDRVIVLDQGRVIVDGDKDGVMKQLANRART